MTMPTLKSGSDEDVTAVRRPDRIRTGLFRLVAAAGQLQALLGERATLHSAHRMDSVDAEVMATLLSLGGQRQVWVYLAGTAVERVEVRVGHLLIEAERARPTTALEIAAERGRLERGRVRRAGSAEAA